MSDKGKGVVLLANDLMLSSTVGGFVLAEGLPFHNPSTASAVIELAGDNPGILLIIDLETPGLDMIELAENLPPETLTCAVAYGPHVHTARLESAKQAGIGRVLSRGQFSSQASSLIKDWAAD